MTKAMNSPTLKIVSGGKTGADRGDLDWAMKNGIEHGGWCELPVCFGRDDLMAGTAPCLCRWSQQQDQEHTRERQQVLHGEGVCRSGGFGNEKVPVKPMVR
jgi:hypothetical protein